MDNSIHYFMWGYQRHFRLNQQLRAKRLLQTLDRRFEPELFLIGILVDDFDGRYPACVEPEKDFWLQSTDFDDTLESAKEILPMYPESQIFQSHPLAKKRQDETLFKCAIRDSVRKTIETHPEKPEGMQYFLSYPVKVEGYMVLVALGLQEYVINSYPKLAIVKIFIHEYRSYSVPVSLIDSTVFECLHEMSSELLKPDPGSDCDSGKAEDEILRAAGNRLIRSIGSKIDNYLNQENSEYLLYDSLNRISSLKYEQAIGKGKIVLSQKDHPAVKRMINFIKPISVENSRAFRKILELTSEYALNMNAKEIWGLAVINDYADDKEDLYEISILGYHHWELRHAGKILMHVRNALPFLPIPNVDENKLRMDIPRIFNGIPCEIDLLISLIKETESEKHGTTLIISANAESEANRLNNQAILIEPLLLTPELLKQLMPIDGAVLVNPEGVCYAIGVILDGIASASGSLARGARYNSAIRYIQMQLKNTPCMAIVVSEDGGVDYIPDLPPTISHSKIKDVVFKIEEMQCLKRVNPEKFHQLVDWLYKHKFYLTAEDCERANTAIAAIDEKLEKQNPDGFHIIREDLTPHSTFTPDLYYDDLK